METSIERLHRLFPGRMTLTPKEVAHVLYGRDTRRVVERLRQKLEAGVLIPNLRRLDGRWLVPIIELARALDALAAPVCGRAVYSETTRSVVQTDVAKRRKSSIGPRLI